MSEQTTATPDSTAERVALWRAAHVALDDPPHVLVDEIGLQLAAPGDRWLDRPDMSPGSARTRATIVARARLAEDTVAEAAATGGVRQYVVLGAGLDTFAQREASRWPDLRVFEIDRPAMQAWKRLRLDALGLPCDQLAMVPVDFETDDAWLDALTAVGFDRGAPAVVAALGVTQYLTRPATVGLLRQAAALAPGLRDPQLVDASELARRYFAGRADGLRPSSIEAVLTARTAWN